MVNRWLEIRKNIFPPKTRLPRWNGAKKTTVEAAASFKVFVPVLVRTRMSKLVEMYKKYSSLTL
jgi:hypothetical protein